MYHVVFILKNCFFFSARNTSHIKKSENALKSERIAWKAKAGSGLVMMKMTMTMLRVLNSSYESQHVALLLRDVTE